MVGTIPVLFKEATKEGFKESYIIPFVITFALGIMLLFFKSPDAASTIDYNFLGYIKLTLTGMLIACATIIPGISATVLLTIMGFYGVYLNALNTLNLKALIPMGIGFGAGAFVLSKVITKLLKKYYGYTFFAILGFTVATIPALFFVPIKFNLELVLGIITGALMCFLTIFVSKKASQK